MEICDIERKEINFGCLEYGDVFEINGEILVKTNVKLSVSKLSGGLPRPRFGGVAKSYHLFIFVSILSSLVAIHQMEQQLSNCRHQAHFSFSQMHRPSGLLVIFIGQ
jgi:hypothetical protein